MTRAPSLEQRKVVALESIADSLRRLASEHEGVFVEMDGQKAMPTPVSAGEIAGRAQQMLTTPAAPLPKIDEVDPRAADPDYVEPMNESDV